MDQQRLITTEKSLSKTEIIVHNEKFIMDYVQKKGWDINNLSTNQLLEITTSVEYRRSKR
jgi:hypothetical protein